MNNRFNQFSSYTTPKITSWYNPTEKSLYAKLWIGPENNPNPWMQVEFPSGKITQLGSEFDDSIQKTNKEGVIIAGKVPQLVRLDENGKPAGDKIHPILDSNLVERQIAYEEAQKAILAKAMAAEAAQLAAGKMMIKDQNQKAAEAAMVESNMKAMSGKSDSGKSNKD